MGRDEVTQPVRLVILRPPSRTPKLRGSAQPRLNACARWRVACRRSARAGCRG